MAHIASCLANSEPKSISPTPSSYSVYPSRAPSSMPFSARLLAEQQLPSLPQQQRYQLFPRDKKLPPIVQGRVTDSEERAPAPPEKDEAALAAVRGRLNSHNLIRRRKISVPELGPMTTVHEVAMDSPTIPARPALHERSSSAPEESAKDKVRAHMDRQYQETIDALSQAVDDAFELIDQEAATPRRLAPLVIPKAPGSTPKLQCQRKPVASPSIESLRPPRVEASPRRPGRLTPDSLGPRFADRITTSVSAPVVEGRGHFNGLWELPRIPASRSEDASRVGSPLGHARGASDSGGIMDRGRPRKRVDPPPNNSPVWQVQDINEPGNIDRKAFEELPLGVTIADAAKGLGPNDAAVLRKQAVRQAEKFEILTLKDVETLSKELRQLDDRTTYLRRTYMSLRAGRRNLHSRICQYLRATHGARFSHEAMLKQEEALAELDASIDEWFNKLEQAENRRMRVRQKLLEHVAAAAILPLPEVSETPCCQQSSRPQDLTTPPRSPERHGAELPGAAEQQQKKPKAAALAETAGSRCGNASPPPMPEIPRVPSNILELAADMPVFLTNEAADAESGEPAVDRGAVESIRIYAGSDLLELLTDVENEITRLSKSAEEMPPLLRSESQVTRHARALTHEKLSGEAYTPVTPMEGLALKTSLAGIAGSAAAPNTSTTTTTTTTINEDDEGEEEIVYLTSAVYQPPK